MKIFAEKEAENFLRKEGFDVVDSVFINKKSGIKNAIEKFKFPIVMKVSGKKILHKNSLGGVKTGIEDYENALKAFDSLMKIKNSEGIIIQNQIKGKEFLLGIKNTPEFEHVIAFGIGGTEVEKMKKVTFRICPLENKEISDMVREITNIKDKDLEAIKENIKKLCRLSKKYPSINEFDINPLMLDKGKAIVVDARIVFG
jgi:acetate---CoA ligase (ADP-forming)